jgi:hypothetical protein
MHKPWRDDDDLLEELKTLRRVSREHSAGPSIDILPVLIKALFAIGLLYGVISAVTGSTLLVSSSH